MTRFLVTLTPMEPYFLGGERTLNYPGSVSQYRNLYFVRSDEVPSQPTILGGLRYLILKEHGKLTPEGQRCSDEELKKAQDILIGPSSFNPSRHDQTFGVIRSISSLFIQDTNGTVYIPTPLDHHTASVENEENPIYKPFEKYRMISTLEDDKIYTEEYDVKKGMGSGWISLKDGSIVSDMFTKTTRVGINRRQNEDGFFKKEYCILKKDCAFALYCDLEDKEIDWHQKETFLMLGQGKSVFRVCFSAVTKDTDIGERIKASLRHPDPEIIHHGKASHGVTLYCIGDTFVPDAMKNDPYKGLLTAMTAVRDFRCMSTEMKAVNGTVRLVRKKNETLYRLIRAGSIAIAESTEAATQWVRQVQENTNLKNAGFQNWVIIQHQKTADNEEERTV